MNIAIIEDELLEREILSNELENLFPFYEIKSYSNVNDFLEELQGDCSSNPGVIITDLDMSGTNGVELLRRIRAGELKVERTTIVVALSVHQEPKTIGALLSLEVDEILTKPVKPESIKLAIDKLLTRKMNLRPKLAYKYITTNNLWAKNDGSEKFEILTGEEIDYIRYVTTKNIRY
jgi:DNA-binding NarL/FixJ family response regulator